MQVSQQLPTDQDQAAFAGEFRKLRHELGERIKELTILHRAAQILAEDSRPAADVLRDLVVLMPPAWQYPEITAARIAVANIDVATSDFMEGPWLQEASFLTSTGERGLLQVVYLEPCAPEAEGPFLAEERSLIESLAQMVRAALERRRAWQEVQQINAELEQRIASRTAELQSATHALEAFTYSVAHDLKAPLRGIDGYSRLLLEDYADKLDQEGRSFLYNIRTAAQGMSQLIDDLLAYSRLERRNLSAACIDVPGFVAALVEERRADIDNGRIEVVLALHIECVVADSDALAQVLRNYLDNALKFTRNVAAPRIEITAQQSGSCWRFSVRDNGIGFDMRYHDRIFEIFERLHRAEDHPGTGIGLAIVRKALERLGGRAWAESAAGEGATFHAELPVREPALTQQP